MTIVFNGVTAIIENGQQFVELMHSDANGRYKSWEHCYSAFAKYKGKELTDDELDFLCLHISFYLASLGMYRGSSFLLQKDYKVHAKAIKELMNSEYLALWGIKCEEYINDNEKIQSLFSLTYALKNIYDDIRISANDAINRDIPAHTISDTLITKILMGTLGCVPAYDRYFNDGIKKCGVASAQFNQKSIQKLSQYYVKNITDFETWRQNISYGVIEYPQMKILDMCFWQIGYSIDIYGGIIGTKTSAVSSIQTRVSVEIASKTLTNNTDKIFNEITTSHKKICDDCLSEKLQITPRQQVQAKCSSLFKRSIIKRNNDKCDFCCKYKLVNYLFGE